jgi:hypothetical protein
LLVQAVDVFGVSSVYKIESVHRHWAPVQIMTAMIVSG